MQRRSFLAGTTAAALAAGLAHAFTVTRQAWAEPVAVRAHPRLLLHDFTGPAAVVESDTDAAAWFAKVKADADAILTRPIDAYVIPDGLRLLDTSRETLRRIYSLGFAFGIDGDTAYADRMWAELAAVCAFPDWNAQRHFLDTAEMTHAVALGYDWLYDHWTPEQRSTLVTAIVDHGLRPGIEVYAGRGMGASPRWHLTDNNWNIVCNGGLLVGALAVADVEPDLANQVITSALGSLPIAVALYGPDGGYPEGLGSYWGYATKYLVLLIECLTTATDDDHDLTSSAGLDETGMFPIHLTGPTDLNFNYYDAGASAPRPPEMFWLARQYRRPEFGWWGKTGADESSPSWTQSPLSLLWYDPELASGPIESATPLDSYFGRCEVATMRSGWETPDAVFVGGKGGDNTTNHGNLDLGDFVLDALGERWAVELGGDDYNLPGYFSGGPGGRRWSYYRNRGEGQNTVVINPGGGDDQVVESIGTITRRQSGPTAAVRRGRPGGVLHRSGLMRRGWRLFDQRRQLIIQDELQAASDQVEAWWFLHTTAEVSISADGRTATLVRPGTSVVARIASPAHAVFYLTDARPLWTSPAPDGQSSNAGIRKLAIRLTEVSSARLTVQLSPLHPGEQLPRLEGVEALERWNTGSHLVATLSSIMINGEPISGFAPGNFSYDRPLGDRAVVTAKPTDPRASVRVHRPGPDGSVRIEVQAPARVRTTYPGSTDR